MLINSHLTGFNIIPSTLGPAIKAKLTAHWRMEETGTTAARVDAHTNGLNLTANSSPSYGSGKIGTNAVEFDNSVRSDFLSRADETLLRTGDIDYTLCCWMYLNTLPSSAGQNYHPLAKWQGSTNEWNMAILSSGNTIKLDYGSGSVSASNFGAWTTGTWNFVVWWHDSVNNQLGIQINNGTANTSSHSTGNTAGTSAFYVGALHSGVPRMRGRVDSLSIFKGSVLSAAERTYLYNSGNGRDYPF